MNSIRRRLLLALGLGLLALFVVGGIAVYLRVRTTLRASLDRELMAHAKLVASRLSMEVKPEFRHRVSTLGASLFSSEAAPDAAQRAKLLALAKDGFAIRWREGVEVRGDYTVFLPNGDVLARSAQWPESDEFARSIGESPADVQMPDGRWVRAVRWNVDDVPFGNAAWDDAWRRIRGNAPGPVVHVVAVRELRETAASLASLRAGLITAGIALPLLSALLIWFVVGRSLRPLERLRRQVRDLEATTLHERIDLPRAPTELTPVVHALNASLDRLEQAFDRERRSAAHMAHELRTPIAELRSLTEVAKQWPDDAALQARCVEQGHEISQHMSRVVSALLRVTRAESGEAALVHEPIELMPRIERAREGLAAACDERTQEIHVDASCRLEIASDPEVVDTMLANVLQNAVEHAPKGSAIEVAARSSDGRVTLTVCNPCGDMTAEQAAQATDMFWRRDPARTHSELAGLGLPLVKELARAADVGLSLSVRDHFFYVSLSFNMMRRLRNDSLSESELDENIEFG